MAAEQTGSTIKFLTIDGRYTDAFFFFSKKNKAGTIGEQMEVAERCHIPSGKRIGLIDGTFSKEQDIKSAAKKYLSRGSLLVVKSPYALGKNIQSVQKAVTWFHDHNYRLMIADVYYYDNFIMKSQNGTYVRHYCPHSNDGINYETFMNTTEYCRNISKRKTKKIYPKASPRKNGRGRVRITLELLDPSVRKAFRDYCQDTYLTREYIQNAFLSAGYDVPSETVFNRLCHEMDEKLLQEHKGDNNYYVFRSRVYRIHHGLTTCAGKLPD